MFDGFKDIGDEIEFPKIGKITLESSYRHGGNAIQSIKLKINIIRFMQ